MSVSCHSSMLEILLQAQLTREHRNTHLTGSQTELQPYVAYATCSLVGKDVPGESSEI